MVYDLNTMYTREQIERNCKCRRIAVDVFRLMIDEAAQSPDSHRYWEDMAVVIKDGLTGPSWERFSKVIAQATETASKPTPMTLNEVRVYEKAYLNFGKHQDKPISDVPLEYLEWLQEVSRRLAIELDRYLNSDFIRAERNVDEILGMDQDNGTTED